MIRRRSIASRLIRNLAACQFGVEAVRVLGMKTPRFFLLLSVTAFVIAAAPVAISQRSSTVRSSAAQAQLVIIDTDIGDDIDDAFALALALKSPELKILGVTTTFGDTEMRARLLDRYLTLLGEAIFLLLQAHTPKPIT